MSFNNATFAQGATLSASGGTTKTLKSLGSSLNSNSLYIDEDTDATTRRTVEVSTKAAKVNATAPGGYTQARGSILFIQPKVLANGNKTTNTVRIEGSFDPETTDAERLALVNEACQLAFGSSFAELWTRVNPQ